MLYVDLDGVMADFENSVISLTGEHPDNMNQYEMWTILTEADDFFFNLEFMHDALELWSYVKDYNPTILTGIPYGGWASDQKIRWVGEKLGWDYSVITCFSSEKALYCSTNDVLIDDRIQAKLPWEEAEGIFIHHTDAGSSIEELKQYGY